MDRLERFENPQEALIAALQAFQSNIWTALPGIYQGAGIGRTANIQPALTASLPDPVNGFTAPQRMPLCINCPVVWPSAGGFEITFPLTQGDEGLLVFASRAIDAWWQSGGVQGQVEFRMHDLSDGFFIPALMSQAKASSTAPSTNSVQIRKNGVAIFDITDTAVKITANVQITGSLTATGAVVAGQGGADQVGLQTHIHPSNGAPPTPGH